MINFELPRDSTRVWDLAVPIVQEKNTTHVYLTNAVEEPELYNELCFLLRTASEAETFHVYLNTPGGIVDSGFMIINAMKASKANIVGHLHGCVASIGTVIALSCDDLEVEDHISWMSHNYSGAIVGKGHEMKARQEFVDKTLNDSFSQIHEDFFRPEEIQSIIDGKDIWMGKDEIIERWAKKKATAKSGKSCGTKSTGRPKKV